MGIRSRGKWRYPRTLSAMPPLLSWVKHTKRGPANRVRVRVCACMNTQGHMGIPPGGVGPRHPLGDKPVQKGERDRSGGAAKGGDGGVVAEAVTQVSEIRSRILWGSTVWQGSYILRPAQPSLTAPRSNVGTFTVQKKVEVQKGLQIKFSREKDSGGPKGYWLAGWLAFRLLAGPPPLLPPFGDDPIFQQLISDRNPAVSAVATSDDRTLRRGRQRGSAEQKIGDGGRFVGILNGVKLLRFGAFKSVVCCI